MTPSKLTDTDRQMIVELYRQPEETSIRLAERYEVSLSTIGRILKAGLAAKEYADLQQQKRQARFDTPAEAVSSSAQTENVCPPEPDKPIQKSAAPSRSKIADADTKATQVKPQTAQLELLSEKGEESTADYEEFAAFTDQDFEELDESESLEELVGEDIDLDDFEEDDEEDDLDEEPFPSFHGDFGSQTELKILPLAGAAIPRVCYLVVDQKAELVTQPLREFQELGRVPDLESLEKTLPIFDNHRVAKRFSKHNQRIIKLPDGRVLHKVTSCLQAKGITRLMIDGQVYSL